MLPLGGMSATTRRTIGRVRATSVLTELGVPAAAHPLAEALAEYPSVAIEVEPIGPIGGSAHSVWVEGSSREAFVYRLRRDGRMTDLETVGTLADRPHSSATSGSTVIEASTFETPRRIRWETAESEMPSSSARSPRSTRRGTSK